VLRSGIFDPRGLAASATELAAEHSSPCGVVWVKHRVVR
jgi:hypothetical protein